MPSDSPDRERRSRWSVVASWLFGLAAVAFSWAWYSRASSGIERGLSQLAAVSGFAILWGLGAVSLLLGVFQSWRHRWIPRLPVLPLVLAFGGAALCSWIIFGQATPERLVVSAGRGDLAWVERCLGRGIDVDARYEELLGFGGRRQSPTALGAAAESGELEVVECLLAGGAGLEELDSAHRTPCEAAIASGRTAVVERLLDAGAELRPQAPQARPAVAGAISLALSSGGPNPAYSLETMLELLVRHGADPGSRALLLQAMWMPGPRAARALTEVSQPLSGDADAWVGLLRALVRGEEERAIRIHRDAKIVASAADPLEDTGLLLLSAKFGRVGVARHLLDTGLAVDARLGRGEAARTALRLAIIEGQVEVVEFLVERGADIEGRVGSWGTALHTACSADRVDVAAALIRAGADLEAPRSEASPEPPLFACMTTGSLAMARLLLESGADATAQGWRGGTAAEVAQRRGKPELAALLRSFEPR